MHTALRRHLNALVMVGVGLVPCVARADTFQLEWSYRWSWGFLQHETGLPDLDPSANRSFYAGAVGDYDISGHDELDFRRFIGSGGDVIVEDRAAACDYPPCFTRHVTFELGRVFADEGDDGLYRLEMTFDHVSSPYNRPMPRLDREFAEDVSGRAGKDGGPWYGMMSTYATTTNTRVATPVPEPGALVLLAVGGLLAMAGAHRRGR